MVKSNIQKLLVCILFIFLPEYLQAQQVDRYMVFFSDKENNGFSLSKPEAFLSPRALKRRNTQSIALTEEDLPVSAAYVEAVDNAGGKPFYRSRWFNAVLIEAETKDIKTILSLPRVDSIALIAPGSKLLAEQNERKKRSFKIGAKLSPPESTQNNLLGVPQMQDKGFTGNGKLIAIFDGGFTAVDELPYFSHFFENGNLIGQHDFTTSSEDVFRYSSHGTKSLSTIAAIDSGNFIGTAPLAEFLLAVTEDVGSEFVVEEYNWLMAAEWADSAGADVISASLGYNTFDDPSMDYTYSDLDGKTTVSAKAASMAAERGMLVVVSAGNAGNSSWKYIVSPADANGIIAVGAIRDDETIASFSSRGPTADGRIKPEVVALGVKTTVADQKGGFTVGNGTSYAAPQIAGFAASVWQAFPSFSSKQIRELILDSGSLAPLPDTIFGWGKPFFPLIEEQVSERLRPSSEAIKIYPNPVLEGHLFLEFKEPPTEKVFISLYSLAGKMLINNQKIEALYPGKRTYLIDLNQIPKGFYVLDISGSGKRIPHKIIKY